MSHIQKPALEQIGRREHAFMSSFQRAERYSSMEIRRKEELEGVTPLDVRRLIAGVILSQREDARHSRENSREDLHARARSSGRGRSESLTYTDELSDEDELDEQEWRNRVEGHGRATDTSARGGGKLSTHQAQQQHSSRDQNVGTGVTYAEYLLWKNKRKHSQQGEHQLEALKNSLNIQLRNARRHMSVEVTAQPESVPEGDGGAAEGQDVDLQAKEKSDGETEEQRTLKRNYSKAQSEVDFILSRSNSRRLDAIGAMKRKFSSSHRHGSAALRFGGADPSSDGDDNGDSRGGAAAEAGRRARGESVLSARASLSLRAQASLLRKLSKGADMWGDADSALESIAQSMGRKSVRRRSTMNKLGTIQERSGAGTRGSLVQRGSMYAKKSTQSELDIEDARIIAHTIVHGVPPPPKEADKDKPQRQVPKNLGAGYDLQILEYIANDELTLAGWENVDLVKMNDNETFSGHSFRFDETDDKERAAVLREFTKQVAVNVEQSASAVENEFRAALVNLNRLMGKKVDDSTVHVAAPVQSVSSADAEADHAQKSASGAASETAKPAPVRVDRHRHHHAIMASGEGLLDVLHSNAHPPAATASSTEATATSSDTAAAAVSTSSTSTAADIDSSTSSQEATGIAELPRRPSEPKPSAAFASPRKKVVVVAPDGK
jgi:hypothetical protein